VRKAGSVLLAALLAGQVHAQGVTVPPGESIYRQGVLPSGRQLTAKREPELSISGAEAACSNCHRRSGLGEIEGSITIPPISGPYLFRPRASGPDDLHVPYIDGMRIDREPYTDATLARAIREGLGADGSPLNYLMPHYDSLGDSDMAALIGYLKGMTSSRVPGVTSSAVNFATIITPDADPVKRRGMLAVLDQFFSDQNEFARAESPHVRSSHPTMIKANRRWQLHVWELNGAPATWEQQLHQYLAHEPVLAVISGLGGNHWAPVHRFCEQASLPCLFPNVDLPVAAERDFYPLYFSRGVLLEADLLAHQLIADKKSVRRVVQVFRADDIGEPAAKAVTAALAGSGIQAVERPLRKAGDARQLAAELGNVGARDALLLWLRPNDIAALANVPVRASAAFMSGLMGGLGNAPVPAVWRPLIHMAYPFDLPEKRRVRVDYTLGWLALYHLPVVDEQVQADTYVACNLLSETLTQVSDSLNRDYLIERIEGMLEHRIVTGYYPRLALAPHERFASKGGYIVHFTQPSGAQVSADTDWIVP
jgi:hypothetical protein